MPKFEFTGDILVPGTIVVEADNIEKAIVLVSKGSSLSDMNADGHDFTDTSYTCLGFDWNQEDPTEVNTSDAETTE